MKHQQPSPKSERVPVRGGPPSPADRNSHSVPARSPADQGKQSYTHANTRRDRNISVDLSPEQKAKLKKLAEDSGIKVTEYLRAVIDYAISKEMKATVQFTLHH